MFIPVHPKNPLSWLVYIALVIITFGLYMVVVIFIDAVTTTKWYHKVQRRRQRRR